MIPQSRQSIDLDPAAKAGITLVLLKPAKRHADGSDGESDKSSTKPIATSQVMQFYLSAKLTK